MERRYLILTIVAILICLTGGYFIVKKTFFKEIFNSSLLKDTGLSTTIKPRKNIEQPAIENSADFGENNLVLHKCQESAKADDPEAWFCLGVLHMNGQGFPKSDKEAALWFRKAAQKAKHAVLGGR